jgi:hypothetical protein
MPHLLAPCLPTTAAAPPTGSGWLHEIKHDGFRLMAWRAGERVRLYARNGHIWTSCLIAGPSPRCRSRSRPDLAAAWATGSFCVPSQARPDAIAKPADVDSERVKR